VTYNKWGYVSRNNFSHSRQPISIEQRQHFRSVFCKNSVWNSVYLSCTCFPQPLQWQVISSVTTQHSQIICKLTVIICPASPSLQRCLFYLESVGCYFLPAHLHQGNPVNRPPMRGTLDVTYLSDIIMALYGVYRWGKEATAAEPIQWSG
jgi:hypothetical protein